MRLKNQRRELELREELEGGVVMAQRSAQLAGTVSDAVLVFTVAVFVCVYVCVRIYVCMYVYTTYVDSVTSAYE